MIIWFLLFLVMGSLVFGFIKSYEMGFRVEFNTFLSPFFRIGISFQRYRMEDGVVEDELMIGLFVINVAISFFKQADDVIEE